MNTKFESVEITVGKTTGLQRMKKNLSIRQYIKQEIIYREIPCYLNLELTGLKFSMVSKPGENGLNSVSCSTVVNIAIGSASDTQKPARLQLFIGVIFYTYFKIKFWGQKYRGKREL